MGQYRKKPVVIEAIQLPIKCAPAWLADAMDAGTVKIYTHGYAMIDTLEGRMRAETGDWIIQGIKGEIYPCKPDIFAATYEPADEADDDGVDPTTTELMKPRGNSGIVSVEICFDALLLIGDTAVTEKQIEAWTIEQRNRAYDWAMRLHLFASDNDDVYVPERPDFILHAERRTLTG